ncbi:MAG: divalent-cation tolerance protein CutA [Aphanocapsa sp. GSE-SYN-MK-11-07L]|jgi:periplasmic divalent cation tolerance protein|nr:divalent-cation tolerance protein CutA [Aphanocapsa sp. GSE-SYN-MK-11-07L]
MSNDLSLPRCGVVLVTASSQIEAQAIARALVQEKLAACVSITAIESVYRWQEQLHQEPEWQLVIKTDLANYAGLEARIQTLHSYAVPEIIALPIVAGAQPYLAWIAEQTQLNSANA